MNDGRACVVLPTYNERENLPLIVPRILEAAPQVDVLVVDDNSPDGTGTIADELAAREPRVRVLHRPRKQGLGRAYLAGFAQALERGYGRVLEMDADFSHDPSRLPALLAADADLVLGSRYVPGGGTVNWGLGRRVLSRGGSLYARTILGVHVRDLTGGFKCFRREVLESLDLASVRSSGYAFQIELTYRALRRGFRVRGGAHHLRRPPRGQEQDEPPHRRRGALDGVEDPLRSLRQLQRLNRPQEAALKKARARSLRGLSQTCAAGPSSTRRALVEHPDARGHAAGERHLVRHHQHGAGAGEVAQHREHLAAHLWVERAGGLVEQQHLRLHGQGPRDGDALLLAAGELGGPGAAAIAKAHALEERERALLHGRASLPANVQRRQADVLQHGEMGKEVESLEHHAHAGAQGKEGGRVGQGARQERQPGDAHAPRVERLEPVEAAQESALAASRRTDERDGLAGGDFGVDAAQHATSAVRLVQVLDGDDHGAATTTGSSPIAESRASSRAAMRASG